jgi:hypothetical protein
MCVGIRGGMLTLTVLPLDTTPCIWSEFVINVFLIPLLLLTFLLRAWTLLFKFGMLIFVLV